MPLPGWRLRMFIGMAVRSGWQPAWKSAASERARARASGAAGQTPASGWSSCSRSRMAMESKVAKRRPAASSHNTGTSPVGDSAAMLRAQSAESNFTMRSANGMSRARIASHGRSDQEE